MSFPLSDLYKYRKYRSNSIRDLLRAMRNKRHHYRELPEDLKTTLGDIPDGYMYYFSSRFPRLLLHCYTIMTECKDECVFKPYYPDVSCQTGTLESVNKLFFSKKSSFLPKSVNASKQLYDIKIKIMSCPISDIHVWRRETRDAPLQKPRAECAPPTRPPGT